ncbi:MAG: OmpH family outer membrane protein [Candidatus Sulfopaludibacter sp.]|nr:OmpH family outer membrane protein [Candidatus Sulfopaludibacter sp.]
MFSRMGFKPLLACSALFVFSQVAAAQIKVAVVDIQRAVFESAEITKANADMQATFKPRQDKINLLASEIQALQTQLQNSNGKLTPAQETDIQANAAKKQRELKYAQDDLQSDADAYRNDTLQKSSVKMNEVIKKLAEGKGLDLVVDSQTAHFFKPALDITDEVIAAYNKAYPVAGAPAPAAK